jgi:hypothetical protein
MPCDTIGYEKGERTECLFGWEFPSSKTHSRDSEPDEWNVNGLIDWYEAEVSVDQPKVPDIAEEFKALAEEWKRDTWSLASIKRRIAHPSYLKIVGMGEAAIPLLIRELRREPDYWFYALEAITRYDPSPRDADIKTIIASWLAWGESRGY